MVKNVYKDACSVKLNVSCNDGTSTDYEEACWVSTSGVSAGERAHPETGTSGLPGKPGWSSSQTNDNRKAAGYAPGAGVSSRRSGQSRVWTSAVLKAVAVGNFALIFCLTGAAIFLALEVSDLQLSDQKTAYELSGLRLSLIKRYHELSDLKLAFHRLDRKAAEFRENISEWMQQTEAVPARLAKAEEAAASVAQRNDSGLEEETLEDDMMNPEDKPEEGNATTPLALPVAVTCPNGYKNYREVCYKVFATLKAFYEAAKTCQADGGTLAMPRDAEIDAFLISLKNNATQDQGAWFGLHDEGKGVWAWIDGTDLGSGYSGWYYYQPYKYGLKGQKSCALYRKRTPEAYGKDSWLGLACDRESPFICQVMMPAAPDK